MREVRLMREKEVVQLLGVSRTTLWRWCTAEKFPPPVYLSSRLKVWDSRLVIAAIEQILNGEN
jgi:predicted DNA-binding transcriptional regulator AlpA